MLNTIQKLQRELPKITHDEVFLRQLLSLMDLTSLNVTDTKADIQKLCQTAASRAPASVCVYPQFVATVKAALASHPIKIATVINFPHGSDPLVTAEQAIEQALDDGANEIDIVYPYGQFLTGDTIGAQYFIQQCKQRCGPDVILKVILETGTLPSLGVVEAISRDAIFAGADFLKTSTGKVSPGATFAPAAVMLLTIKDLAGVVKRPLGFKVSGGIRSVDEAEQYVALAQTIMGADWVQPQTFRIGASHLMDVITKDLA